MSKPLGFGLLIGVLLGGALVGVAFAVLTQLSGTGTNSTATFTSGAQWNSVSATEVNGSDPRSLHGCSATVVNGEARFTETGSYEGTRCIYGTAIRNTGNIQHKVQKYRVFDDGSGQPWTDGVEQSIILSADYCGQVIPAGSTASQQFEVKTLAGYSPGVSYGYALEVEVVTTEEFNAANC